MHLVGAPALARLFLVDADQLAVIALVEGGSLEGGDFALAAFLEDDVESVVRALERRGEGGAEAITRLLDHGAGAMGFRRTFLGKADVLPAGEAVEPVPLALAVADENEDVVPGRGRLAVGGRRHRGSRQRTRRGGFT